MPGSACSVEKLLKWIIQLKALSAFQHVQIHVVVKGFSDIFQTAPK
jgi:hypothetical protein